MNGPTIRVMGNAQEGEAVGFGEIGDAEWSALRVYLEGYCRELDLDPRCLEREGFGRLLPLSRRPYGNLYAY